GGRRRGAGGRRGGGGGGRRGVRGVGGGGGGGGGGGEGGGGGGGGDALVGGGLRGPRWGRVPVGGVRIEGHPVLLAGAGPCGDGRAGGGGSEPRARYPSVPGRAAFWPHRSGGGCGPRRPGVLPAYRGALRFGRTVQSVSPGRADQGCYPR